MSGCMRSTCSPLTAPTGSGYGLALQMFALIVMLASVPLTMRIAPLVRAVELGDDTAIRDEVAHLGAYVNVV